MDKIDLVSIISPCYNCGEFIAKTIKSVLDQTYQNWELLIIDDCSTDNSSDIILNFQDPRIKYYKLEQNCGAAIARNKGLAMAKGRWIAFLDCDDLWDKCKLEKQLYFMKINSYAFSYTCYREIDSNGLILSKCISGPSRISRYGMISYCWPGCLTVMYDVEKIGIIQIPSIRKNNDYALWLLASEKADCYLLNETLASYRKRSGSISNQSYLLLIKWHYILFKDVMQANALKSFILTINNLFWGIYKKVRYKYLI